MIRSVPIKVECYSGYRNDETPRSFIWNNRRYEIVEIIDRWYQTSREPAVPTSDYFKIRAEDTLPHFGEPTPCWQLEPGCVNIFRFCLQPGFQHPT
jgi:hypothetical protein